MGGQAPSDVVWTDDGILVFISKRVVDALSAGGFTGWATIPAIVHAQSSSRRPRYLGLDYFGLAITGRCGPVVPERSTFVTVPPGITMYRGLTFDPATWDGSDLFRVKLSSPFVLVKVKEVLEVARVENLEFTPLTEVLSFKDVDDELRERK
jgi:hypothetical protein